MKPITQDDVFFLLEPLVGLPMLLQHSELSSEIAALLSAYDWQGETTLDTLCEQIESTLFNSIYSYTRGQMAAENERGEIKKIYTSDLSQMAETLMDPVFARIPVQPETCGLLNRYALSHLSLPVLKRLYTDFREFLDPMNQTIFARVVTENFPEEAYRDWLQNN
jgi:hypothetical protein